MFNRFALSVILTLTIFDSSFAADKVGFFSPQGVSADLVAHTDFAMINVQSVAQLKENLALAQGHAFKFNLDFGPLLATIENPDRLSTQYTDTDGKTHRKQLPPAPDNKIRALPTNAIIDKTLSPYLSVLQTHGEAIDTIFLVDEPYLNGVPKKELERAAKEVKRLLRLHGLHRVKLGVIFASAMFDPQFAKTIDRAAGDYALSIDHHYLTGGTGVPVSAVEEWSSWKDTIKKVRLTTYDSAGNMYTQGGIPRGFEVIAFDFYLSTILLDSIHDKTLAWFAVRYPKQCGAFKGTSMHELRKELSFFHDGPVLQGDEYRARDKRLLEQIFTCRMEATTDLLQKQIRGIDKKTSLIQPLLITESSNNGVLEFDAQGNIEPGQPEKLNESRVFDEVARGLKFYRQQKLFWTGGIMFFTYQDEYDKSIKMRVGGAKNMPSVLSEIYRQ